MGSVIDLEILCYDDQKIRRVEEWLLAEGYAGVRRETGGRMCDLHASLEVPADVGTHGCVWMSEVVRGIMDGLGGDVATIRAKPR